MSYIQSESPFKLVFVPEFDSTEGMDDPRFRINYIGFEVYIGDLLLRLATPKGWTNRLTQGRWKAQRESLAAVPAHLDAGEGIRRYKFENTHLHTALHIVDDATKTNEAYCTIHTHDDSAELNVIVPSQQGLTYEVYDGDNWNSVTEPSLFWFKPGQEHCAIARRGSGLFFVSRLPVIE